MCRFALSLALATTLAWAGGLASRAEPEPDEAALAAAVRRLGAEDYATRAEASRWLWALGPRAESALLQGLRGPDPEIVARCRELLDRVPYGITPEMPRRFAEIVALVRENGAAAWPAAVAELLDLGPPGLAIADKLLERLPGPPEQRSQWQRVIDRESWRLAVQLIAQGSLDDVPAKLERSAVLAAAGADDPVAVRHYAAFLALRGQLDAQIPRWKALVDKNHNQSGDANGRMPDGSPDGRASRAILAHLLRLHGPPQEARALAEAAGRADLREAVAFDQDDWQTLLELPPPDGRLPPVTLGLKAFCLEQLQRPREAADAIAELQVLPISRSQLAPPLVFRALMFLGQVDAGMQLLAKYRGTDALQARFDLLALQHRFAEALPLLDPPPADRNLILRWQWDASLVRTLHVLGDERKLDRVLAAASAREPLDPVEFPPALDLIEQLLAQGQAARALPLAALLLAQNASPAAVFEKYLPRTPLAAEIAWRFLRLQHPGESHRATLERLAELFESGAAPGPRPGWIAAAAAIARAQPFREGERWLLGLGEACQALNHPQAARGFFEEAGRQFGMASAGLRLGDLWAEGRRFRDAAEAYAAAARADPRNPLPLWLAGWALSQAGDAAGPERMSRALLLPLADEDVRAKFADELAKRTLLGPDLIETARRERRWIVRITGPGSNGARNAVGALSNDAGAFSDRAQAADTTRRFLFRMLRTNAYFKRNEGYLVVLHRLHEQRARAALEANDPAAALREFEIARTILPGQSGPTIHLVPWLENGGRKADADRLYQQTAETLDRLIQDYPNSAHFRNSRAWLAARCRRDLDRAVGLARRAVELTPRHPGYRETLAEVLFQRGETQAAQVEIRAALKLDPRNPYLVRQEQRLQTGNPLTPLPDGARGG